MPDGEAGEVWLMYVVIAGGGKIGEYLANVLLESGNDVTIIE